MIGLWFLSSSIPTTNGRASAIRDRRWVKRGLSTMDRLVPHVFAKAQEKFFAYNGYYFIDHEIRSPILPPLGEELRQRCAQFDPRIDKVTIEP